MDALEVPATAAPVEAPLADPPGLRSAAPAADSKGTPQGIQHTATSKYFLHWLPICDCVVVVLPLHRYWERFQKCQRWESCHSFKRCDWVGTLDKEKLPTFGSQLLLPALLENPAQVLEKSRQLRKRKLCQLQKQKSKQLRKRKLCQLFQKRSSLQKRRYTRNTQDKQNNFLQNITYDKCWEHCMKDNNNTAPF